MRDLVRCFCLWCAKCHANTPVLKLGFYQPSVKRGCVMFDLTVPSNVKTMSSREIANVTKSKHDNVLKTIRALIKKGVVSGNETPYVQNL